MSLNASVHITAIMNEVTDGSISHVTKILILKPTAVSQSCIFRAYVGKYRSFRTTGISPAVMKSITRHLIAFKCGLSIKRDLLGGSRCITTYQDIKLTECGDGGFYNSNQVVVLLHVCSHD